MAIDYERACALELPTFDVHVERGRLRAFASSIGETDPVYTDLDAARAAGHPDLPALPTFLFSLCLETPDPFGFLADIGADPRGLLHGEQTFGYRSQVHAGDTVTVHRWITDAYPKNARMDFVVQHVDFVRAGLVVGEAVSLLVIREVAAA